MRIFVAMEMSGRVRDAFIRRGHYAISCDYLPSESDFGPHIQGNVFDYIYREPYDLLICHPDCTYLASSGLHWNKRIKGRSTKTEEALKVVKKLLEAPIDKICLENPVGAISSRIRKPDQIIHPWEYGHSEEKTTCLWLKNLPKLVPTNILQLPECGYWSNQTPSKQNKLGPSKDRAKIRSYTYQGIANAFADQWS